MRKDPTEWRNGFKIWKETGESPWEAGRRKELPKFAGGTEKVDWKRWDDAELTSYEIPFIENKAIKLTNAGVATGAVLSTNLLDTIADNADRAGIPVKTGLGIAVKESTLGNPTDDRSAWRISSGIRNAFNNKYPGTKQHINDYGNTLAGDGVVNYFKGHKHWNDDSKYKSAVQEAFEFYKQHPDKYNPGQKNYPLLVDKRGEEVMQSPEIQQWLKNRNVRKAVGRFNRSNPLLNESKFNLPRFAMGTEGDDIEELIRKRLEQRSDNTSVQRLKPVLPIKRNFITEAQRKHAAEAVSPDTRSSYQRKQSLAAKLYANQQYQKAKDDAKRAEGMDLLMKTMSPSTYVEAATGLDLGTAGRLITDATVFGLPGLVKRGIKSIGNLAKIGKLDGHNYHVSAELTNEPVNIPFEKYKKEAIQGSLELLFGKNVADKVNRFYQKDVYPRFINQTYTDLATDEVRDLLGYNGLPKGIKLYGYHDPNSIAFGFSNDGNIYMNYAKLGDELRLFESIIHESEHAQRQLINNSTLFLKPWYKSGYIHVPQNATDEQKIFAKSFPFRGYIDSELQRLLYNYPLPSLVKGVDINPLKEAGASNRELRAAISEDYGGRLGVDLDATINNMSNKELERYINGLNGYTDWIYNNRSINFDGIKNTLKKVPAIATPITILNKYAE